MSVIILDDLSVIFSKHLWNSDLGHLGLMRFPSMFVSKQCCDVRRLKSYSVYSSKDLNKNYDWALWCHNIIWRLFGDKCPKSATVPHCFFGIYCLIIMVRPWWKWFNASNTESDLDNFPLKFRIVQKITFTILKQKMRRPYLK